MFFTTRAAALLSLLEFAPWMRAKHRIVRTTRQRWDYDKMDFGPVEHGWTRVMVD